MMQLLAAPWRSRTRRSMLTFAAALAVSATLVSSVAADTPSTTDPRATLTPGNIAAGIEAGVATLGTELLANRAKPWGDPANPGSIAFANSDLAFQGDHAFVGSFNGFQIYSIADPANPTLVTSVACPGGQGEVSVYGNLLFMSVEETRAKIDCTATPPATAETRFRGVRIFDISNPSLPGAGGRRPDVPRLPHAHTAEEPERRGQSLCLRERHRRRPLGDRAGGL